MVILDKNGDVVESIDYERGKVDLIEKHVTHIYVIDTEESGHWETVAEYPDTGGADVKWHVDTPETGHWETRYDNGQLIEHYDGVIPEDWPKEQKIADTWQYGLYVEYTPSELEEIMLQKAEAAAMQARAEQMQAATLMFVRTNAASMTDEDAQSISMLFPDWQVGGNYEQGDILRYNGELYRVSQKVTGAQADHTPDKAVSLYKKIGEPTGGLFPWSQPQGAHDAYKNGDKVSHNGKTWVSTVDNNVWEPGVYGWEEAKE